MTELKVCYVPILMGLEVGLVKFGENGYYTSDWGQVATSREEMQEFVDNKNEGLGISRAEMEAMQSCSMFGCWQNYEKILKQFQDAIREEKIK